MYSRRNKIIETAWSGLIARAITIGASLIMVPLAVHYLGKEQYGLWIAVSSLIAMLAFLDGGAGNAVINMIAHASGVKENSIVKIVSTAFFSLLVLALFGCLLFLIVFPYIFWGKLLGLSNLKLLADLNVVVVIVGLSFFINILATLVGKIQRGLQLGILDNLSTGIGSILSLLFTYIAIYYDTGLIGFVSAILAGPMFAYIASNIHYLFFHRRDLRPKLSHVDSGVARQLFSIGGMFFVLQIASAIQMQSDNLIIANMLGSAAVADYAICMKLFLIVPMLFSLLLTPLWPAYTEAFASGDTQWAKRIFLKSMRWALLISIPSACLLVIFGGKIIEIWVGYESVPSTSLLIGCAIWLILMTVGNALGVFLNGLQLVKTQIIVATTATIMNVFFSIILIQKIGVVGAIFGSVISYTFFTIIPYFFILRKILHKLANQTTNIQKFNEVNFFRDKR